MGCSPFDPEGTLHPGFRPFCAPPGRAIVRRVMIFPYERRQTSAAGAVAIAGNGISRGGGARPVPINKRVKRKCRDTNKSTHRRRRRRAVGGSGSTELGRAVSPPRAQRRGERAADDRLADNPPPLGDGGSREPRPSERAAYRRALPRCFRNPRPPAVGVGGQASTRSPPPPAARRAFRRRTRARAPAPRRCADRASAPARRAPASSRA